MDVKEALAELKSTVEEFKKANDKALDAKADTGHVDSLLEEQVKKLNKAIDDKQEAWQSQMDAVEARLNRMDITPGQSVEGENLMAEIQAFNSYLPKPEGREPRSIDTVDEYKAYKKALVGYLRFGPNAIGQETLAILEVGSDPAGGYYVTPDTSGKMVKLIKETSPIRQLADSTTIGTDALEGFRDLDEAASGGWVGEKQARPVTGTAETGKYRIPVHEQYANPKVTQKMLDDSGIDIESWHAGKVSRKFGRDENTAFVNGNGSLKPRGFLTYAQGAPTKANYERIKQIASGASGAYASSNPGDKLLELVYELKAFYRTNAKWLMSRITVGATRKLKDGQGNYLWLSDFSQNATSGTLLGYPVFEGEDMPALASNSLSVALADWKRAYLIVDRTGIRVLRDPLTDKPNILFYTTKRVGGDVNDFDAIKIMKFATSV